MAIQPIDLQTLFTQLDKVGKAQTAQREGLAIQQEIQGVQIQRKTEEHIKSVNEAQNTGDDGVEKVKERGSRRQESGEGKKKEAGQKESEREAPPVPVFCDPRLGRNIDISL
ncbi:MAG: hypothetical protein LBB89_06770 [Treponema sp.]|jgi:hypothetical protein|nr:hypothetical protein [Treponema sp.]